MVSSRDFSFLIVVEAGVFTLDVDRNQQATSFRKLSSHYTVRGVLTGRREREIDNREEVEKRRRGRLILFLFSSDV